MKSQKGLKVQKSSMIRNKSHIVDHTEQGIKYMQILQNYCKERSKWKIQEATIAMKKKQK